MHNEGRQVIEQMHVIDTEHHRGARGSSSQRLDHAAHKLEGVTGDCQDLWIGGFDREFRGQLIDVTGGRFSRLLDREI
jgi:hypothetical protein